jgi:hypothetical protein
MQHLDTGKLEITIVEAELVRDTEFLGKMDPYCKAYWTVDGNKQEWKTDVIPGGGSKPNWRLHSDSHTFTVHVKDMHDHVSFKVKDEEVFANEEVGAC